MSSYDDLGTSPAANYGTEANFAANYQLTEAFVAAHKTPFLAQDRIWLGGYSLYQQDMSDYAALLKSQGVLFTARPSTCRSPLGQRLGAGRRGRAVPGQPEPATGTVVPPSPACASQAPG